FWTTCANRETSPTEYRNRYPGDTCGGIQRLLTLRHRCRHPGGLQDVLHLCRHVGSQHHSDPVECNQTTVLLAGAHLVGVDSAGTTDHVARPSHRGTKRQESVPKPRTNGGKGFVLQLSIGAQFSGSSYQRLDLWLP